MEVEQPRKDIKQPVWRKIRELSDYDFTGSLDDAIKLLQDFKKKHTLQTPKRELRISVEDTSWEDGTHMELQFKDIETSEEFQNRIVKESKMGVEKEKQERLQLKKLKEKYEK